MSDSFVTLTNFYGGGNVMIPATRLKRFTIIETMSKGTKLLDPAQHTNITVMETANSILAKLRAVEPKVELQLSLDTDD